MHLPQIFAITNVCVLQHYKLRGPNTFHMTCPCAQNKVWSINTQFAMAGLPELGPAQSTDLNLTEHLCDKLELPCTPGLFTKVDINAWPHYCSNYQIPTVPWFLIESQCEEIETHYNSKGWISSGMGCLTSSQRCDGQELTNFQKIKMQARLFFLNNTGTWSWS